MPEGNERDIKNNTNEQYESRPTSSGENDEPLPGSKIYRLWQITHRVNIL